MTERQQLAYALLRALEHPLLETCQKNEHKPRLASLELEELRRLQDEEHEEFTHEEMWVRKFGKEPYAMLLEVANELLIAAERLRRVDAITVDEPTKVEEWIAGKRVCL